MPRFSTLGVLMLVAACAAPAAPPPVLTPAAPPPVVTPAPPPATTASARFTHTGPGTWTLEYTFSAPVDAVAFNRRRIDRRHWKLTLPADGASSDAFIAAPHPFTTARFEVATDTLQPESEYAPFLRYTDRGELAFTGQLALSHARCKLAPCVGVQGLALVDDIEGTVTLVAAPNEGLVVGGKSLVHEASVPMSDDGTYAYFGDLVPVETADAIGVFDHALPEWLFTRITSDIPRMFTFYREQLGPLGGSTPTVYLAFAARPHGSSFGGGTLPHHVVAFDIQLNPTQLTPGNTKTLTDLDKLVAHEAAHFWNDELYTQGGTYSQTEGEQAAWLHEGTADAFAVRALHAIGAMGDAAYRDWQSEAASECALWLSDGQPLTSSTRPGHSRAFYACGAAIDLVAEAASKRHDAKVDLFTFWRAVFLEGKPQYDEATFFTVLDRLGGDHEVTEALRHLVHDKTADPVKVWRDLLEHVGLTTKRASGALPQAYEDRGSIPAIESLLPAECVRAIGFHGDVQAQPYVKVDGACPGLSGGDKLESLAGVPIGSKGATAYTRGYASCAARHKVEVVTTEKKRVTLPCASEVRALPAYFEIVKSL